MPNDAPRLRDRLSGLAQLAVAVAVSSVALTLVLSGAILTTTMFAVEAAPALPEPPVDVSEIDDLTDAVGRQSSQSSVVLDANGEVIGRFNPEERYEPLAPDEIPDVIETTLLAAEDEEFRTHAGFDPEAIVRAMVANVEEGSVAQGGSTLTQQLAKNLFTSGEDRLERKLVELQLAMDLEEHFTKDEILAAYVNSAFLGNGIFGFEAAARSYFGKPAADLTLSESAQLVALLPAPTDRNPRTNPEAADAARRRVLDRVARADMAGDDEVAAAEEQVPEVRSAPPRVERWAYYMDYVRRYLLDEAEIDPEALYGGGLTIETALIPELQYTGRLAIAEHVPADAGPEAALAVVDVDTGLVRALVGGRDFASTEVNLALGDLGGGTGRQAGSSFKPFVLATALERGNQLGQQIDAPEEYLPRTVDEPKPVENFSNRGYGQVSLLEATIRSINTAYVNLTEQVGAGEVRDTATRLGVRGLPESPGPSIGIGAYETSPLDMATAYAGFAAEGRRVDVGPVTRILDADGEVFADLTPSGPDTGARAIDPQTARQVNQALEENVRRGTATRAAFGRPAAAKTGTSDEYANAWLAGHTPQFATAVWVGHPEGNVPMRDVAGFARVTGGSIPALIWHDVMAFAHRGVDVEGFTTPEPPTGDPPPLTLEGILDELAPSTTTSTPPSSSSTTSSTTTTAPTTTRPPTTTAAPTTTAPTTTTTRPTTTTTRPTTTTTQPTTTTTAPTTTTTAPSPTTAGDG